MTPVPSRPRRLFVLPWVALLLALRASHATAAPAAAHAGLIGSDPAEGDLSEDISQAAYVVLLVDGQEVEGQEVEEQEVQQGTGRAEGGTVTQAVAADAPAGAWTTAFRVLSVEGHPLTGEVAFDVAAATEPEAVSQSPGATSSPAASESPSDAVREQGAAPARVGGDGIRARYGGYVLVGAALLAAAGLVLLCARRRTR